MLVNFSLRVGLVAVLFLVLFFPAQMALSQRPTSTQEIMNSQTDIINKLEEGTEPYRISIGDFQNQNIAFALFSDCGSKFSKVSPEKCFVK